MRLFITLASMLVAWSATPAAAHFVWLQIEKAPSGQSQVNVYFSESPEPGAAHLVDRLQRTKVWVRDELGKTTNLELHPAIDEAHESGRLVGDLSDRSCGSAAAQCLYGVFERGSTSLFLNYYARYQATGAQRCDVELPLEIEANAGEDRLTGTVTFRGKPVPNCEVVVIDANDETHEVKTNEAGQFDVNSLPRGTCAIRAGHIEADKSGEFEGKAYSQTWHIATLTLGSDAERTATQLLSDARRNRAVWEDFPGFRGKLHVALDGERRNASILVTPDGDVELEGLDGFGSGFVDRHLKSLVMHRMPGPQFEDHGASFEADDRHVLGRKVRLAEEVMGSVYRIDNDVVTEVNRKMGKQNFTISVMDVEYNAEHQYLPHIFTVSFWDENDGNLKTVESVYHQWTRVDKFDLPAKMVVIATGDNAKREVLKIEFSDLQLLDGAPATAQASKQTGHEQ
jgi:hypothetical protein